MTRWVNSTRKSTTTAVKSSGGSKTAKNCSSQESRRKSWKIRLVAWIINFESRVRWTTKTCSNASWSPSKTAKAESKLPRTTWRTNLKPQRNSLRKWMIKPRIWPLRKWLTRCSRKRRRSRPTSKWSSSASSSTWRTRIQGFPDRNPARERSKKVSNSSMKSEVLTSLQGSWRRSEVRRLYSIIQKSMANKTARKATARVIWIPRVTKISKAPRELAWGRPSPWQVQIAK